MNTLRSLIHQVYITAIVFLALYLTAARLQAGKIHETAAGDLNRVRALIEVDSILLGSNFGDTRLHLAGEEEDFKLLFDGKTLKGWDGDLRLWSVKDGAIVGSTDSVSIQRNTFLIYTVKQFGDFVFRAQVKLRNHNSGIQFRSEVLPEWVCNGYQADMAEGNWWGSIYDEGGQTRRDGKRMEW